MTCPVQWSKLVIFFKEKSTKKDTLGSQKRSRLRAGEITEQNHSHITSTVRSNYQ